LKGTSNHAADQLSTADVTLYQEARLAEGAAAGTINRETSALSAALYNAAKMTVAGGKPLLAHVPTFPSKLRESAPPRDLCKMRSTPTLAANAKSLWLRHSHRVRVLISVLGKANCSTCASLKWIPRTLDRTPRG